MPAMSLRQTVTAAMIGAVLGCILVVAAMAGAYLMLERANSGVEYAAVLRANVGNLNLLIADLAVHRTDRARLQWKRQYETVTRQLAQAPRFDDSRDGQIAEVVKQADIAKSLVDKLDFSAPPGTRLPADEADAQTRMLESLTTQSRATISRTREFYDSMGQAAARIRSTMFLTIVGGSLTVIIGGAFVLLMLCRGLLFRILRLRGVIQDISQGNLDAEFPTPKDDEMGDVIRELDRMRLNLMQSMAELSRVNLELVVTRGRLEDRVEERTASLETANRELESFTYAVSHDLRAPLRAISGFSQVVLDDYGAQIDADGQDMLRRIVRATHQMSQLIADLLQISRLNQAVLTLADVNLSHLVAQIGGTLKEQAPDRDVALKIEPDIGARCDERLISIVLTNLIENAWKFTSGRAQAEIEFGCDRSAKQPTFFIRDNGAGFDMEFSDRLFKPFQRLHSEAEFAGTGIGLATVARIIRLHGGKIWAESAPGQGATFYLQLGTAAGETAPHEQAGPAPADGEQPMARRVGQRT